MHTRRDALQTSNTNAEQMRNGQDDRMVKKATSGGYDPGPPRGKSYRFCRIIFSSSVVGS
jgi:hypothetical protein